MAEQLSDRDDLAAIIRAQLWNTDDDGPPVYHSKRWAAVADAILAAGWVRVTSAYLDPDAAADELRAVRLEQWLDRLAPSLFTAMVCTHEFDGATCDVCWDNTQRVCRIIQRALLVGDIEQAHLTQVLRDARLSAPFCVTCTSPVCVCGVER